MKKVIYLLSLLTLLSSPLESFAQKTYIPVGKAQTRKTVLAFAPIVIASQGKKPFAELIDKVVYTDLQFMGLFRFLPRDAFLENPKKAGLVPGTFKFTDWSAIGTEFLIKAMIKTERKTKISLEAYLYDINRGRQIMAKRYTGNRQDIRTLAHTFANDVVQTLTGLPGIFLTKIAMSCDRTKNKEIHVMNFDGTNVRQVTKHRSIAFSPTWSPDGNRIAYSLYVKKRKNIKNIDLYEFNFLNNSVRSLVSKKGMNSGATYSPDGNTIALTMSYRGNPEIYTIDLNKRKRSKGRIRQLTKSWGFDVDPAWSPDGKEMAFVSSRRGKPMIFRMNRSGGNIQRLTFAGRYNATPTWSPQNNKIAFAGWTKDANRGRGGFDIFIMNPDGTNIERLTKNQGNNEDPHFSPDGNFIVFSSNRTGKKNVYVMNIDGSFVKRLTYGLGNCVAPKWSNPPQIIARP